MPLTYYPRTGEVLLCDFATGFVPPEMTKRRPVVVISPRLRRRADLVAVVPLSTTLPNRLQSHHCEVTLDKPLPKPFSTPTMWAKCDMLATVALHRMDRFKAGHSADRRIYRSGQLEPEQIRHIRIAILFGLGLDALTIHL